MGYSNTLDTLAKDGRKMVTLPSVAPIFPLAGTILLPKEVLALHIFEPRYQEMIRDALASNRLIGMVEPTAGAREGAGEPSLRRLGCIGRIAEHHGIEDGRYLIWLIGLQRFRIDQEITTETSYRQARVTYIADADRPGELARLVEVKREVQHLLPQLIGGHEETQRSIAEHVNTMTEAQLVAFTGQVLDLPAARKRQLQAVDTLSARLLMVSEDLYTSMQQQQGSLPVDTGQLN